MYIFSCVYHIASRKLNNCLVRVFNRPKGHGLFLLDVNMRHVFVLETRFWLIDLLLYKWDGLQCIRLIYIQKMAAPSSEVRDVSADVAWNAEMEEELKRVLLEYGNGLLKPGDSIEELLRKLDKLEHLLQHLMQERKPLIEMALKPAEEALISNALMRHEEVDVRITVVSCISEIIRITAPKEPYNEDQMKDYFKLVNIAYQKLPSLAGRAYSKAVSTIQDCFLLSYMCSNHFFLANIRSSHPQEIPSSMEHIMVLMIQNAGDSEEFALEAAKILLSTLKKGNENVSPCAFQLARKVYEKCANDLKNYLPEAVRHMGVAVQEYDDVVISSLHGTIQSDDMNAKEIGTDACGRGEVSVAGDLVLSNLVEKNCSDQINRRENVLQEAKDKGIEAYFHGEVNLTEDGGLSKLVENNGNDNLQVNENTNECRAVVTHVGDQINQQERVLDRNKSTSGPDVDRINSDILIDSNCLGEGNSSQGVSSSWMPFEQVSLVKHHDVKHNDDFLEKNNSTDTIINGPPVEVGDTHHMQQELKGDDSPILKKRIRKPSSVIRAEEGYDPLWMLCECASTEDSHHWKNSRNKNTISKSSQLSSSPVREPVNAELKPQKMFSQEKKDGTLDEDNGQFCLSTAVNNLSKTMTSKDITDEERINETEKRSGKILHACMTNGILKNPMKSKRFTAKLEKGLGTSSKVDNAEKELSKNVTAEDLSGDSLTLVSQSRNKSPQGESHSVEISNPQYQKISSKKKRQHSLAKKAPNETSKGKTVVSENLTGNITVKTLAKTTSSKEDFHSDDISNLKQHRSNLPIKEKNHSKKRKHSLSKKALGETCKGQIVSEIQMGDIIAKTSEVNGSKKSNDENLVGCKIKVWWPLDETYYEGKVTSFDHLKKAHKVDYDDGETEILDLTKERWEVIDDYNLSSHVGVAVTFLFALFYIILLCNKGVLFLSI
ncbi:sister chromatid cohesion protein PDS5 homolog D-like [Primulina tabacum]|uniref:sister chromatid cohesion protein PDS5 homolog D-like n=1 Tax=Primulina tabacum TaxID=48773 RepID=UPI003F591187